MTFLNHFHQGGHPGARPERVRCISRRRSPWPHLSRTWSRSRWSSHWVQRALHRGDSGGRSSETGAADRVGSLRTLPSEVAVPTGRNWAHMTWKCPPKSSKSGVVDIARIPKAWPPRFDFGEEGRPSHDFSYFSIPSLPWVFHRQLFKVLRKKNEIHCMYVCMYVHFMPNMCLRVASEVTLLGIPPCQTPMCGVAYSCSYVLFTIHTKTLYMYQ